jgi:hypothetical protein
MEQENELHQLHAITALQNTSVSFIEQNLMEESILEEEFPSWDTSSSDDTDIEQNSTSVCLDIQESDKADGDLGNSHPGDCT